MKEEWKDIIGYEGIYQVSNFGRVKIVNYRNSGIYKIRNNRKNRNGYYSITLIKFKKSKTHLAGH